MRVPPNPRIIGLAALAAGCAVVVATGGGPARFVAGAVLVLYLPGRLGVQAWCSRAEPVLRAALVVPLSVAAAVAVGLGVAATRSRFEPTIVGGVLAVVCVGLAGVSLARRRSDITGVAIAMLAAGEPAPGRRRSTAAGVALATVPVLALTALLGVRVVGVAREKPAGSRYTEFAVGADGAVVVHNGERGTVRFRYELLVDGRPTRTAGFTLRPGERQVFPTMSTGARAEALLYRGDETAPSRRLTI